MSILRGLRSDPPRRGGPMAGGAAAAGGIDMAIGIGSCFTTAASAVGGGMPIAAAMPGGMNLGTYRPAPAAATGAAAGTEPTVKAAHFHPTVFGRIRAMVGRREQRSRASTGTWFAK